MPHTYTANTTVTETSLYNHYRTALQELAHSATDAFIRTGQILSEAMSRLPHGQFESLLDEMEIERSTASRWMAIADSPPLLHSVQKLPPHYSTLYEMTKIPAERLEELIADGTFTVSTTRADVVKCLPKPKTKSNKTKRTKSGKAIIKARDKAWADIQADPNLRKYIEEVKLARTPPTPTKDQLLAMVEQALMGDTVFQAKVEALLVKATGRLLADKPTQDDDDDAVAAILQAAIEKPLSCDRPPPTPAPGPVQEMSTKSIVPENVDDDFPEMPEFLRRKEEIRDGLLERMPYLRHDPDRLEEMVLSRLG